tara:strand:- start:221115 stop:221516 length:402 start_codon:yes stop_codon:yes gene_type:complete
MSVDQGSSNIRSPLQQRVVQQTLLGLTSLVMVTLIVPWLSGTALNRNDGPAPGHFAGDAVAGLQIDINLADSNELALLPRVGPILADRIVDDRRQNGEYISVQDLQRVFGIGPKTLGEISRLCVVNRDESIDR